MPNLNFICRSSQGSLVRRRLIDDPRFIPSGIRQFALACGNIFVTLRGIYV